MSTQVKIMAKIRQKHDFLIKELNKETIKSVCDYLYQENIFDRDQIDMIEAQITRIEMARKFLSLMACETDEANERFVERLENDAVAPYLAETIRSAEIKNDEKDVVGIQPLLDLSLPCCVNGKSTSIISRA